MFTLMINSLNILQLRGLEELFFYFIIYSIFGWLLENYYSRATSGVFWKDGFLKGPMKPMYGIAPLLLVLFNTPDRHWSIILFLCLLIPSFVEYVTGVLLKQFFNIQWWDYSNVPFQLHGHICLSFSLCWFGLSLFVVYFVHPYIATMYANVIETWHWLYLLFAIYFSIDVVWAVRTHYKRVEVSLN